jgi:hypothetical protein
MNPGGVIMKRFMVAPHGISPLLSIVILLVIVIVSFAVCYTWISGNSGSLDANLGRIQIQGLETDSSGRLVVYVVNLGDEPVELDPTCCVYVNGELKSCTLDNRLLVAGQTAKLNVNYSVNTIETVRVKLVTKEGISTEASSKFSQPSAQVASVTIASDPPGLNFVEVDGVVVGTPVVFSWEMGSSHTIETASFVSNESVRYVYAGWSDNGIQNRTYVVSSPSETIKVVYRTQYYLSITSFPGTPSLKSGWFDDGELVTVSVSNSSSKTDTTIYICSGWTGVGSVPRSGNETAVTFTMSSSSGLTWNWVARYKMDFVVNPPDCGFTNPSGTGFYDPGLLSISATPKTGYKFSSWNISGSASVSEFSSASTTALINGSGILTANFIPATVAVIINSDPGGSGFIQIDGTPRTTPLSAYWQVGSVHTFEAISQVAGSAGTRYIWTGWSDGKTQIHNYTVPASSITITANFKSQYQVTFSSTPVGAGMINPSGIAWYDASTVVSVSGVGNSGYEFGSWNVTGSISVQNPGFSPSSISINGPGAVMASFVKSDVIITVKSSPQGSGFVKVDGVLQPTPYSVNWIGGSVHTLEALSPISDVLGMQYVWKSWSDGGLQTNTYSVPSSNATIEAVYKTQYRLMVKTSGLSSNPIYVTTVKLDGLQVGAANDESPLILWMDAGSSTGTLDIEGIVFAGAGIQAVFNKWDEDSSTANPRTAATIGDQLNLTAIYRIQYQVSFSANPPGSGSTNPSGVNNWYFARNTLAISATTVFPNAFSSWTSTGAISIVDPSIANTTATINSPGTITANFVLLNTTVAITISSNLNGSAYFKVDDNVYSSPQTFYWRIGDRHRLEAISPISGAVGVQYVWAEWSDGGSQIRDFIVPIFNAIISINYKAQYQVTFTVNPSGGGSTSPSGISWCDLGTIPISSIANPGYKFLSWTATGALTVVNSTSANTTANVNGSGTITANLGLPVSITIKSNPVGSGFVKVDGALCVTPYVAIWGIGSVHSLEALSPVSGSTGTRYVWTDWSNGGTQLQSYVVPSANLTLTANYKTQYYLTVSSTYDSPTPGSGWFDSAGSVTQSVSSPAGLSGGTRYQCSGWTGNGSVPSLGVGFSVTFTIRASSSLTWNWVPQYQVTFVASPSSGGSLAPVGTIWCSSGTLSISATSGVGYRFSAWSATGAITFANSSAASTVATINGPGNVTAVFVQSKTHIQSIQLSIVTSLGSKAARAIVTVVDPAGRPVSGALVTGYWSGNYTGTSKLQTDNNGVVTFTTSYQFYSGTRTFAFRITDIALMGWIYDSGSNVISNATVTG